jgi:hypothetical protein
MSLKNTRPMWFQQPNPVMSQSSSKYDAPNRSYDKTRAQFEIFIIESFEVADAWQEIWNPQPICERTIVFSHFIAVTNPPRNGRQGVLRNTIMHLIWWATRILNLASHAIRGLQLQTRPGHVSAMDSRQQRPGMSMRNLCTEELFIIYDMVASDPPPDSFLAYAICTVAWATAMRTGSLTKTTPRKFLTRAQREDYNENGLLKWSNFKFFMIDDSVAAKVTFKHIKGERHVDERGVPTNRTFTFMPMRTNRQHLDVSGFSFGVAYARRLFQDDIETMLSLRVRGSQPIPLRVRQNIAKEAAFLPGWKIPYKEQEMFKRTPLSAKEWNQELRRICLEAGLLGHFTSYS